MDEISSSLGDIIDMIVESNDAPGDNPEYLRGQIELVAEMLPLSPQDHDEKKILVEELFTQRWDGKIL